MNPMTTFDFAPGLNLRVIDRGGSPWFVAADVSQMLDMRVDNALRNLDADERATEPPRDSWRPVGVSQADVADLAS